ncbi:MAG: hypothetical protein HZA50_04220 [Planctomycetes bacterium]|nr:hypothetical protein [Planctomycetota bacterium]
MIELKCKNCGRTVKVPEMLADKLQPDSPAGRVFKCPGCGQGLGGAERQTPPQAEELKCAKCGRIVSDPAEFVRGKGLCAECSRQDQPADAVAADFADKQARPAGAAEEPAGRFVPISETAPQTAPWRNQPRRQMQPAGESLKKPRKAGRESFLYWGLGGIAVLIGIGLIMHLLVFRDTWEEDNRDKAVEMRQEAKALASRGAFEQSVKKYQTLIDLLSSRRLQSSELKDLLAGARAERAEAQKSFDRQQEIARQQQEQVLEFLAGFEPQEQQAKVSASAGDYAGSVERYEQIIASIESRPDRSPEIAQALSRLNQQRIEVSRKLRDRRQAEAATRKAQQEEEDRLAAARAKKEEEDRLARLIAASQQSPPQNTTTQNVSAGGENPAELSRLRQSDVKAMKDSIRMIQDFVAAYRPVQRLAQAAGQADDLQVLAERVQQTGSMLFAPAFEQPSIQQAQALQNWRANCNQLAADMLAACQTIQRNLDTICKLYKDMKIAGLTGDSGAGLLKKLDELNSAEWLKLQDLLQQAAEIVKGG